MTSSSPETSLPSASEEGVAADRLRHEIEKFVAAHLPTQPIIHKTTKVVHDGLWGTIRLTQTEASLIDTPLMQRLRGITQTGPAHYVYPSTRHSRFEHSLGVMLQIQRLGDALRLQRKDQLTEEKISDMRIGALLHDVGHGPFSHTSEIVYGLNPALIELHEAYGNKGSPHEILSRLIVESKPFRQFVGLVVKATGSAMPDLDLIARAITGDTSKAGPDLFIGELLNGPFDADKLDYLFRDSHFSGLPLSVDIERLWHTVQIQSIVREGGTRRLAVGHGGAGTLEQILFAKMVLHTSVYQHHKIRSMECLFQGIIEYIQRHREDNLGMPFRGRHLYFDSPVDFLWLNDESFRQLGFGLNDSDDESVNPVEGPLHRMTHGLFFRRPLVRAMVISSHTIDSEENTRWDALLRLDRRADIVSHQQRRKIAEEIRKRSGALCLPEEVWLDLPTLPSAKAANDTYVAMPGPSGQSAVETVPLNELFPLERWVEQYGLNKWRGHVFCPPDEAPRIGKAAKEYFESEYGVRIRDTAFTWCKQNA